jgi:hypothetical protein
VQIVLAPIVEGENMRQVLALAAGLVLAVAIAGFGCGESAPTIEGPPADVALGNSIRMDLAGVKRSLAEGGAEGAHGALRDMVENFEGRDASVLGDKEATYNQIVAGIKELAGGKPSAAQIKQKVDELIKLADELPKGSAP